MKIIGLTGGIASGKSTVADMLRAAGVPVIDADQLARDAVAAGSPGLAEVVDAFGADILDTSGSLDRPKLGTIVFGDDHARARLNAIVHPRVAALFMERTAALAEQGHEVLVYEVPLLFENGLDAMVAASILVAVPEDVQLARLRERDGFDPEAARARIDSQMPLAEKRQRADYVIDNSGARDQTRAQLDEVWRQMTGEPLAEA